LQLVGKVEVLAQDSKHPADRKFNATLAKDIQTT